MKTFARSSSASRRARPGIAGDRVGEAAADRVHDRGRKHESQQVRVQRDQDLFRQVVDDVAVRRAERVDERLAVGRRLHREVREVQAGRPALGPLVEGLDRRRIEVEREDVVEQLLRFVRGELEVGRAELDEVADRAQAGDRERRVRPARDRHLDDRRRELDEPHDALVALVVLDDVVVVEDEDALLAQRVDLGRDRRRRVGLPGETLEALDSGGRCRRCDRALPRGTTRGPPGRCRGHRSPPRRMAAGRRRPSPPAATSCRTRPGRRSG